MDRWCDVSRARVRGSALVAVLLVTIVVGGLAAVVAERSAHGLSVAGWSREHLALRLAAESAVEELSSVVRRRGQDPSDPLFQALRSMVPGESLQELAIGSPPHLTAALRELGRSLGGPVEAGYSAGVQRIRALSDDATERSGVLVLEATLRLRRGWRPVSERVRVERAFRIARVTAPRPLDTSALFVVKTTKADLRGFRGRMACAGGDHESHTLTELMAGTSNVGFRPVAPARARALAHALAALAPAALATRAHDVVRSPEELSRLLARRRQEGAVSGVIHLESERSVRLSFAGFRGNCLLSSTGPVEVQDIRLEDPEKDSLTIVSRAGIVVTGRTVDASLLCPSPSARVMFRQRAAVGGTVITGQFPMYAGISGPEFGACSFRACSSPAGGDAPGADARRYVLGFAPCPMTVVHTRG